MWAVRYALVLGGTILASVLFSCHAALDGPTQPISEQPRSGADPQRSSSHVPSVEPSRAKFSDLDARYRTARTHVEEAPYAEETTASLHRLLDDLETVEQNGSDIGEARDELRWYRSRIETMVRSAAIDVARKAEERRAAGGQIHGVATRAGEIAHGIAERLHERAVRTSEPDGASAPRVVVPFVVRVPDRARALWQRSAALSERASRLFRRYLEVFPESDARYDITFERAEALFASDQHREAARAYEDVLELEPEGEFASDAAWGRFLALQQTTPIGYEVPTEMTPDLRELIDAAQYFVAHHPNDERACEPRYTLGHIYQLNRQLRRAARWYRQVAFRHPTCQYHELSAEKDLQILIRLQELDPLYRVAGRYLEEQPVADEDFYTRLREIRRRIRASRQ